MRCPACDHDNLPGDDLCRGCEMDLAGLDLSSWGVAPEDPFLTLELRRLRVKDAPVLAPDRTVAEATELMRERREGCVFVVGPTGRLLGMFSERDLTVRVIAPGRNPSETRLAEVMSRDPMTLAPDDPVAFALHRMGVDGYRHMPVVDGDDLRGFLSMRTVLRTLLEA